MENQYRYPGTRPFLEEDGHLFFGRDDDTEKLTELITLEEVVVLFGKSGYGKSSLLNAAVIPKLRTDELHEVFTIRLIEPADKNALKRGPLKLLTDQLKIEFDNSTFLSEKLSIPDELPNDSAAIIWYYLKSVQLKGEEPNAITLVFDQFEELNNFSPSEISAFGKALGELLNLKAPQSVRNLIKQKYDADPDFCTQKQRHDLLKRLNLKVVLSLHHDRLDLLDQLKPFLPYIFKYTYELKPLSDEHAGEALNKPAALGGAFVSPVFTYSPELIDFIFKSLRDSNQLIEPFQLQLIGQHAEERIIEKKKKVDRKAKRNRSMANREVTPLELGIKDLGKPENIFKKHYRKVIAGLPIPKRPKVRKLIETVLIIDGHRVPMPEIVIKKQHQVTKGDLEHLLDKRLLRSELNTVQGTSYELSHDSLIKPIQESAEKRKRKRLWILTFIIFGLIIALLLCWGYNRGRNGKTPTPFVARPEIPDSVVVGSNHLIINPWVVGTALPIRGKAPLKVDFTYKVQTTDDVPDNLDVEWRFGDNGAFSTSDSVSYIYSEPNRYLATLRVRNEEGVRIDTVIIDVLRDDVAVNITTSPTNNEAPSKVDFAATISSPIEVDSLLWEFSEPDPLKKKSIGSPITIDSIGHMYKDSVSHTFKKNREYQVRLTLWDREGTPHINFINVNMGPAKPTLSNPPVARATVSPRSREQPFAFTFSGVESTDDVAITDYLWEFQDGSRSMARDTTYVFNSKGKYSVRLTVWDEDGQKDSDNLDLEVIEDTITSEPLKPIAEATSSVLKGYVPLVVPFTGSSVDPNGREVIYEWDFGDGVQSTVQNPVHTFTTLGRHQVKFRVTDDRGESDPTMVTILAKDSVELSATKGKVPLEVGFALAKGIEDSRGITFEWNFGDGVKDSVQNPVHTFMSPGAYKVQLVVSDSLGEISRDTLPPITVLPDRFPVAKITRPKLFESTIAPATIAFDGSGSTDDGSISKYLWDFNDGYFSNSARPTHTFLKSGTYKVQLKVMDDVMQSDSTTVSITLEPGEPPYVRWIDRFIRVQKEHLSKTSNKPNASRIWGIPPDSLNLVGVSMPHTMDMQDSINNRISALMFFFTPEGEKRNSEEIYIFRNKVRLQPSDSSLRSMGGNLNRLIKRARYEFDNRDTTMVRFYMGPNLGKINSEKPDMKNLAGLLEKNKINKKTLNIYFTLFDYSYFDKAAQIEIDRIYKDLEPKSKTDDSLPDSFER